MSARVVFAGVGAIGSHAAVFCRNLGATLVFVEVRLRRPGRHGGAADSISAAKRRRLVAAAREYLAHLPRTPECRVRSAGVRKHVAKYQAICVLTFRSTWSLRTRKDFGFRCPSLTQRRSWHRYARSLGRA